MKKETYLALETYMRQCMSDSAHDREHVYRVLNNALRIAEGERNVDYSLLITACLLHDIGRGAQLRDPSLCHAAVGSEMAYDYLLEGGFGEEFAQNVRDCIRTHRFRKNAPPESLEAKILFDADKLDVTGAMGIARTLMYRGAVTEPLYAILEDGTVSDGSPEEESSFFREYKFKLEKLYDRFYTKRGAEMAKQRQNAAVSFYESLLDEVRSGDCGQQVLSKILK